MGARPIEHGRKVGTKAKQILPMLSTVTANIPHKALFPLHLQLVKKKKKKIRAPRIPFPLKKK